MPTIVINYSLDIATLLTLALIAPWLLKLSSILRGFIAKLPDGERYVKELKVDNFRQVLVKSFKSFLALFVCYLALISLRVF